MSRHQFGPVGIPMRRGIRELMSPADIERFWSKYDKNGPVVRSDLGPCWIWQGGVDREFYGKFQVGPHGHQVQLKAHRVALALTVGNFDGLALHHCDQPRCGNPGHLFAGDQKRNIADREARGRHSHDHPRNMPRGEQHPNAKLTTSTVVDVRRRLARGERHADIAQALGIAKHDVDNISCGKTWRHVQLPQEGRHV